jgi:hypothetical protein
MLLYNMCGGVTNPASNTIYLNFLCKETILLAQELFLEVLGKDSGIVQIEGDLDLTDGVCAESMRE